MPHPTRIRVECLRWKSWARSEENNKVIDLAEKMVMREIGQS